MADSISIEAQVILKEAAATARTDPSVTVGQVAADYAQALADVKIVLRDDESLVTPPVAAPLHTAVSDGGGTVTIKNPGKAPQGEPDIPDWLPAEAAKAGVSGAVWDNRADLPQFGGDRNPKSPWFKAVEGGAGIWPPR